jgi:hypothetical protein
MLRFVLKLTIFLSPILLMLGVIEHKLAGIRTGYEVKRAYLERGIADARVIVTGSSHTYVGVKPDLLGVPTFNMAFPSQDIYYDTKIMLKYLPQAKNAELVVVAVSYFSFEYRMENSIEPWRTSFYYRFWGIPTSSGKHKIGDFSSIALYGIKPTRDLVWSGFPDASEYQMDESGGNTRLMKPDLSAVMDTRVTLPVNINNIPINTRYLEELLDALKARGIQAVFITTPCFRSYYDNMNREVYGRMQDQVGVLSQKYSLKYYNYLKDLRFTVEDFYDNQHLSIRGAEKFSQILRDEVVRKYIKVN